MNVQVINRKQYKVSNWSGGDTTEIFLYPGNGSYADRNFTFRVSTAAVTEETSEFTRLPGIKRKLMVLEGNLRLNQDGEKGEWLMPGDQEAFMGDQETISEGRVTDFNLMLKDTADGKLTNINLPSGEKENIALCMQEAGKCFLVLYLYSPGQITLSDGYTKYLLKEKETVVVEIGKEDGVVGVIIENIADTTVRIIKAEVIVD